MDSDLYTQLVSDFLAKMKLDGKAHLTITAYQNDLYLLKELKPEKTTSPEVLTRGDILYALKALSLKNQHPKSMARYLSSWRQFCAYLVFKKILPYNPCLNIKPPKAPKRLPKALNIEKTNHLLDDVHEDDPLILRDRAMFELLYSSGLRLSELSGLDLNDIDLAEGLVKVFGKGGKERIVPVGEKALAAIRAYLPTRVAIETQKTIFTSKNGNRLSNRQIQNRLNRWAQLANSDRHVTPHMLRHSFASHMLQESGDIRAVQELLGHSNLNTTQIYTSLDFSHLAAIYDNAHPRAKRKK